MKYIAGIGLACALFGCATPTTETGPDPQVTVSSVSRTDVQAALEAYYNAIPASRLPRAPELVTLNASKPLTRIIVASCNNEERDSPALASIARETADLMLFVGDNVYGDRDGRYYSSYDMDLEELRESYTDLAARPEFQAVAARMPVLPVWDDHDFGQNDGGADFAARRLAERIYEHFWYLEQTEIADRPGIYTSDMAGPEGQRVQIIRLDTRFFRSGLTRTDDYGAPGKQRYLPSTDPDQNMLGEAQWAWLAQELEKPAELRLLVTSIQVTPDVHGWEAWSTMPLERQRLYDLIETSGAEGVVLVSGDRHTSFLYKDEANADYPLYEITASSLNLAFADEPDSSEVDGKQIGLGYAFENYGEIEIDWAERQLNLIINNADGNAVRSQRVSFDEISAG